jgi:hypothetical protein
VVVLIGAVGFVVSCFLPYTNFALPPADSWSLYRVAVLGPGNTAQHVGGFLYLFAGVATIAWISLSGLLRPRRWTPFALVAVSVAWSLAWIGSLVNQSGFLNPYPVGYWSLLVSIGVVLVGTIVVWVSARVGVREPSSAAP